MLHARWQILGFRTVHDGRGCCRQVARLALDAVQQGRYIARATSFGMALATAPGATIHPRLLPLWLELLLAPASILMPWLFGRSLSKRIRQWRGGASPGS